MATQETRSVTTEDTDVVLEVRDATVTFDMERGVSRVLNEVDLDIHRNEILGVVGESGSGKSMMASSLLDAVVDPGRLEGSVMYYPTDGEPIDVLSVSDQELKELRWENISFVIQAAQSAFNPTMRIRDHFEETLRAHDADIEEGIEHAHQLLSDLHLNSEMVLNSYPHELSGGMKQRALISLGLVLDPEVLVLDEPTGALDLLMQRSIVGLLKNIKEKYELTIVFVTHDLPVISDIADRLAVMYAFEIAELGPTEKIVGGAAHPYTRALINSVPDIEADVEEVKGIPGRSPDPVNVPPGCSYAPRCPMADEICESTDPSLEEIDMQHEVACHHWEESADAVPLSKSALIEEERES